MQSDSQKPMIIGIVMLGVLMIGGIVFAVISTRKGTGSVGTYDAGVAFVDTEDPVYGNENAKIVVRLFEDFECSACRVGFSALQAAKKKYGGLVKFIWNDVPMEQLHPSARLAANAGRCAEEQGMFWEMYEKLFTEQPVWVASSAPANLFVGYAKDLGMNDAAFEGCLDERRYDAKIVRDMQEAQANKVDATPTFFIGNDRFVGAVSFETWDKELTDRIASGIPQIQAEEPKTGNEPVALPANF